MKVQSNNYKSNNKKKLNSRQQDISTFTLDIKYKNVCKKLLPQTETS